MRRIRVCEEFSKLVCFKSQRFHDFQASQRTRESPISPSSSYCPYNSSRLLKSSNERKVVNILDIFQSLVATRVASVRISPCVWRQRARSILFVTTNASCRKFTQTQRKSTRATLTRSTFGVAACSSVSTSLAC